MNQFLSQGLQTLIKDRTLFSSLFQKVIESFDVTFFINLFILYWSIAGQPCCDGFRWTAGASAVHIHVSLLPQTPSHPGCHMTLSRASLCSGTSLGLLVGAEGERGRSIQGVWDGQAHTAVFKMDKQQGPPLLSDVHYCLSLSHL